LQLLAPPTVLTHDAAAYVEIVQACELNVAEYQFAVLDSAFLIHRGFKSVNDFHSQKYIQQDKNRELYRTFKRTLKMRYPSSSRTC